MSLQEVFYGVGIVSSVVVVVSVLCVWIAFVKLYVSIIETKKKIQRSVLSKIVVTILPVVPFLVKGMNILKKRRRQYE